jgi:RNA polymerase sigma-70 factor (ECF subfamily)
VYVEELLPAWLDDGHRAAPGPAWGGNPVSSAMSRETRDRVLEGIAQLPEVSRNVLLLRDIQGLDTEEAAEVLGITPGATKVRLHRARQALRELLDPHFREGIG